MSLKRRDALALAALVVLAGGLAVGATFAARAAGGGTDTPATVTTVRTETMIVQASRAPVTKVVTKTVTKPPHTGAPATAFGNGTFQVGFDVRDGRYHTDGPAEGVRTGCVWKRSEPGGGVVAQGTAFGPITIVVHDGELLTATGCAEWSQT